MIVEVTAGPLTKMVCDLIDGCGDAMFGQDMSLTDEFIMKAVMSGFSDKQTVTANVTALTHLAAALAESADTFDSVSVAEANSQVSALFNITANLIEIDTFAITDYDAMRKAKVKAKEAAILNSALLSAALKDSQQGTSIAEAMGSLTDEFTKNKGQFFLNLAEGMPSVSIVEIYEQASLIIDDNIFAEFDLGASKTAMALMLSSAKSAEPGEKTSAAPSKPADQEGAQAARDMVEAVRYFALSATYEDSAEVTFLDKVNAILRVFKNDNGDYYRTEVDNRGIDNILEVLAVVSEMIVAADRANRDWPLSSFNFDSDSTSQPTKVFIIADGNEYLYIVNDRICLVDVEGPCVDVSIEAKISSIGYYEEGSDYFKQDAVLDVSGLLSTMDFEMEVSKGIITLEASANRQVRRQSIATDEVHTNINVEAGFAQVALFSAVLEVSLNQKRREYTTLNPPRFTGRLELFVNDFSNDYTHTEVCGGASGCELQNSNEVISFEEASLLLSGQFFPDLGEEYIKGSIYINFDPDSSLHSQESSKTLIECSIDSTFLCLDVNNPIVGENEEGFIGVEFGVSLEFDLASNSDITGIMLTANRTGLDAAQVSLDIAVGASRLNILMVEDNGLQMIVTDQNGDTLSLAENCQENAEGCSYSGNIEIDNEQVATLAQDEDSGAILIIYQDGSFEVL